MSDPLKGGFASFANTSGFKPNTTTNLFGNTTTPAANTGNAGTQGAPAATSAFGGASGGLFGNFGGMWPSLGHKQASNAYLQPNLRRGASLVQELGRLRIRHPLLLEHLAVLEMLRQTMLSLRTQLLLTTLHRHPH